MYQIGQDNADATTDTTIREYQHVTFIAFVFICKRQWKLQEAAVPSMFWWQHQSHDVLGAVLCKNWMIIRAQKPSTYWTEGCWDPWCSAQDQRILDSSPIRTWSHYLRMCSPVRLSWFIKSPRLVVANEIMHQGYWEAAVSEFGVIANEISHTTYQ
jgi:hypothetical protein